MRYIFINISLIIFLGCASTNNEKIITREYFKLYSSESPFNTKIDSTPDIDENSDSMIKSLLKSQDLDTMFLTTKEWTVTLFYADENTPRYDVQLTADWANTKVLKNVPIPSNAQPDPEDDGHMVIIDLKNRIEYDFWQAKKIRGKWSASWANDISIDGDGIYGGVFSSQLDSSCRGSGFALLAGLIFPEELEKGRIEHALIFSFAYTRKGIMAKPATETDGVYNDSFTIPEGARIQLDPDLDLNILNLKPWEKTIAKAMQEYGMICADNGGGVEIEAVNALSYESNPYTPLGIEPEWGYELLKNIPMTSFRVIKMDLVENP